MSRFRCIPFCLGLVILLGRGRVASATELPTAPGARCPSLMQRLRDLPLRWKQLPPPRIIPSGRAPKSVMAEASMRQRKTLDTELTGLLEASGRERAAALSKWLTATPPTELQAWRAAIRGKDTQGQDPRLSLRWSELSLDLGEQLGRADVLAWTAVSILELCKIWSPPQEVLPTLTSWMALAPTQLGERQVAKLRIAHAASLLDSGQNEPALQEYALARSAFEKLDDKLGQGDAWWGEARVHFLQSHPDAALRSYQQARTFYEEEGDQAGQTNAWIGEGDARRRLRQDKIALSVYQKARALCKERGDRRGQARTLRGEALVLFSLGQNKAAISANREARAIYKEWDDKTGQGGTWYGEAEVLIRLGQSDAALSAYESSRALFEQMGDKQNQMNVWLGEVSVLMILGRANAALDANQKARALAEEMSDKLTQSNSWYFEGVLHTRLDKHGEALKDFEKARLFAEQLSDKVAHRSTLGQALSGEAEIRFLLGQNDAAFRAYEKARMLYEETDDKTGLGNAWIKEADLRRLLGHYDAALHACQKARALFVEIGQKLGEGLAWVGEAQVLFMLSQDEASLTAYHKARALFAKMGAKLSQGNAWRGEADVLFEMGQDDAALAAYRKARALFEEMDSKLSQGNAWLGEEKVLFRLGKTDAARAAAQKAIAFSSADESGGDQLEARTVLLKILVASHDEAAMVKEAELLVSLGEKWRATGLGDADRRRFAEQVMAPFDVLVPILARRGATADQRQALRYAEGAHAPVLRDLLGAKGRPPAAPPSAELRQQLSVIQQHLIALDRRRQTTADSSQIEREIAARESLLERLEFDALAASPGDFPAVPVLSEPEIAALVQKVGPVLLFYSAPSELIGFLLRPTPGAHTGYEITVRTIALARSELVQRTETLRHKLANHGLFEAQATSMRRQLGDELLGPFLPELGSATQLIIVPHGPLHLLPLETLTPGGRLVPLPVAVSPSLAALRAMAGRRQALGPETEPRDLVALSVGPKLGEADRERAAIMKLFGQNKDDFPQAALDLSSYRKAAANARHLLLISHAVQTANSRLETYVEMRADAAHAGRLTPLDIAEVPLRAELATLSACDAARADAQASDERLDLTRAFVLAGAAAVLSARWQVPDSPETTQFLESFYRGLRPEAGQSKLTKAQALYRARVQAIQNGLSAQIWAAWVLYGDGK